jgi:hypothetical protein
MPLIDFLRDYGEAVEDLKKQNEQLKKMKYSPPHFKRKRR